MILVFAGAGASSAVSSAKYPTTIEYFNKLDSKIKSDPLFKAAEADVTNKNESLDIENILFRLGQLDKQFSPTAAIHEYQEFYQVILKNLRINPNLSNLIEEINKKVFKFYGQIPEESEIENNWLKLLRLLEGSRQKYEIVTTNYDTNIETALEIHSEKEPLSLKDGFERIQGQGEQMKMGLWSKFDKSSNFGLITKLHGSVNWYGDRNHIHRSAPRYQGADAHPIIYPGFKGDPGTNKNLNGNFHRYFELMLPHVTHALFIGFAFRDEYINKLLSKLNTTSIVTNIGYGAEPSAVPVIMKSGRKLDGYKYLDGGFDVDSLDVFRDRLSLGTT